MTSTPRPRRSPVLALVAGIGELAIILGVLAGLFVIWQVWWTDVVATSAATTAVAEMERDWPEPAPAQTPPRPGVGDPPVDPAYATTYDGDPTPLGVLRVPRWGADYARAVYEGVSKPRTLNPLGIGHYPGTATPGQVGNFDLAGHRTTYSKPFNRIHEIEVGDAIVYESQSTWYVYQVTVAHLIVRPWQNEVLAPVPGDATWAMPPTKRSITLTACHPMFAQSHRYVVHGELAYWMPKENGTPPELTGGHL